MMTFEPAAMIWSDFIEYDEQMKRDGANFQMLSILGDDFTIRPHSEITPGSGWTLALEYYQKSTSKAGSKRIRIVQIPNDYGLVVKGDSHTLIHPNGTATNADGT